MVRVRNIANNRTITVNNHQSWKKKIVEVELKINSYNRRFLQRIDRIDGNEDCMKFKNHVPFNFSNR